jgi:hypothetical protein
MTLDADGVALAEVGVLELPVLAADVAVTEATGDDAHAALVEPFVGGSLAAGVVDALVIHRVKKGFAFNRHGRKKGFAFNQQRLRHKASLWNRGRASPLTNNARRKREGEEKR